LAAGENLGCKAALVDAQVIPQNTLQNGPQISGRFQMATFIQISVLDSGPIGQNAPALDDTAREQCDGRGAMVRPLRAIDLLSR
jgi:hypothetical protein